MTEPALTPYWADADDWTGFCLLIVPTGDLQASAAELHRQVRSRIETDAVLYDLVTVALVPPVDDPDPPVGGCAPAAAGGPDPPGERAVSRLIAAAMAPGHYFAPRGVFAAVVVGDRQDDVDRTRRHLEMQPPLRRLQVQFYPHVVTADPGHGGLSQASVLSIADTARAVIADYERYPDVAVDEPRFLGELARLHREGVALPRPEPEAAPTPEPEPLPEPGTRTAAVTDAVTDAAPEPAAPPFPGAPAEPPPAAAPAAARELMAPVVQPGTDIVHVRTGSLLRRARSLDRTGSRTTEELAGPAGAVSLAYLVFVPDGDTQPREVSRYRRTLAIELDRALGEVVGDAQTGRPMAVAVEVLGATSPLRRHGTVRPAGRLTDGDLPKVPVEYFDIFEVTDSLLDAMRRAAQALAVRDVDVLGHHLLFLATVGLPETTHAEAECARLLQQARITWVHIGREEPSLAPLQQQSPYGVHILTDKDDVVALLRRESEALYRWGAAPSRAGAGEARSTAAAAPARKARRRWWPGRGRPALAPPVRQMPPERGFRSAAGQVADES